MRGARKVRPEAGVSHGNCKCNHWNKNWLSSDVKRKGRRRRGSEGIGRGGKGCDERGWKKQTETEGEKIYVAVR